MKSIRYLGLAAGLLGFVGAAFGVTQPTYQAGELLFKLKSGYESAPTMIALASMNAVEMERYPQVGWVRVRFNSTMTIATATTKLKMFPFVAKVEKNLIRRPLAMPNDPSTGQQWLINRIDLPEAWDLTTGDSNVVIAIIDTGVDISHPDLAPNIVPGRDVVDNDGDPSPAPGADHGTHVAGIASAATNNGIGVAGTGYDCSIMGIRAGDFFFTGADIIEAITWATDNGANVINMSLGGAGSSQAEQDACTYARDNEVLVVAAAGNHGTTQKHYPAAYVGVMAVASSDPSDTRSSFSAYGNWVHVAAPGSNILSTVPGGGYDGTYSGTSMSSPCVAGVAGLVWARGGLGQTSQRVFDIICDNCDFAPGNYTINGRINAFEAALHTAIIQQTQLQVISASMFVGAGEVGSVADLEVRDGSYMNITTQVIPRAGSQGGIEMEVQLDRPLNELFDFRFDFATKSNIPCTAMFWLYNNVTNRWDFIKAFPTKPVGSTGWAKVANMTRYVDGSGVAKMRLRGHNPTGKPGGNLVFTFGVDFAQCEASYEVQP